MGTYRYVTDDAARKWLIANDHDDAVRQHFGEIPDEQGPGRPEVGPMISTRLTEDILRRVDVEAARAGESRAATIRRLLESALPA